jgi:hypothetical protein
MNSSWRSRIEVWWVVGLVSLNLAVGVERYFPPGETAVSIAGTLVGVALAAAFICFTLLPAILKKKSQATPHSAGER